MDFPLFFSVLLRFKWLVVAGVGIATVLAVLSVFRIDGLGVKYRQNERWVSVATVLVTEGDFPLGRAALQQDVPPANADEPGKFTPQFAPSSRFIELANIYAELVTGDAVRQLILEDGPLPGVIQAVPLVATNGSDAALPMVAVRGLSTSPEKAVVVAQRASTAFQEYLEAEQARGGIPRAQRVILNEVRHPSLKTAVMLEGRSKTIPIVVFLTVMLAFVGLAFILENIRPREKPVTVTAEVVHTVRARSSG